MATGVLVSGVLGQKLVQPPTLSGSGAPSTALKAIQGQAYLDTSTSPRTLYVWSGVEWLVDSSSGGIFTALTVSGTSTLGNTNVTGAEVITGTLAVSGLSTLTGGINTAPVVVAAGASPQTANGRSGQVTFSGVSIAGGASQVFIINNTSITGAGTVILNSFNGATAGAALTKQSVVNAAGSTTITITNGTGATTTTANLIFTFLVLN